LDSHAATGRWLLAYLLILSSRLPFLLTPPTGHLYHRDELELALSSVDRFLGVPSTSLAWPGSTLQLLFLPLFMMDFIWHTGLPPSLHEAAEGFARWLARTYTEPWHSVTLLRLINVLVSCAAPLLLFACLRRWGSGLRVALFGAVCLSCAPLFLRHSVMAMGTTTAITLVLAGLWMVMREPHRIGAFLAGLLIAAGIGVKVTAIWLGVAPVFHILTALEERGRRSHRLAVMSAGLACGLLLFCPYVWLEPIRLVKSIVGNAFRPSSSSGSMSLTTLGWELLGGCLAPVVALAITGVIRLGRDANRRRLAILLSVTIAACLSPLWMASSIRPAYLLPALLPLLMLAGIGLEPLLESPTGARRAHGGRLAWGIALLLPTALAFETVERELTYRQPDPFLQAIAQLEGLPIGTLRYVPTEAFLHLRGSLSRAALADCHARAVAQLTSSQHARHFLTWRGLPVGAARALLANFTEDEQAWVARLQVMTSYAPPEGSPVLFYLPSAPDADARAHAFRRRDPIAGLSQEEALEQFTRVGNAALLVERPMAAFGEPAWRFGDGWCIYLRGVAPG